MRPAAVTVSFLAERGEEAARGTGCRFRILAGLQVFDHMVPFIIGHSASIGQYAPEFVGMRFSLMSKS
jgi:hypothetical protein